MVLAQLLHTISSMPRSSRTRFGLDMTDSPEAGPRFPVRLFPHAKRYGMSCYDNDNQSLNQNRKKGISGLLRIPTVHQTTSPSPSPPSMSVPPPDSIALESPASTTPRKRTSKACENCRLRRVKCTGDIPCRACLESSITESCHVRVKARPKR